VGLNGLENAGMADPPKVITHHPVLTGLHTWLNFVDVTNAVYHYDKYDK